MRRLLRLRAATGEPIDRGRLRWMLARQSVALVHQVAAFRIGDAFRSTQNSARIAGRHVPTSLADLG
jgi:hypothetical protein